MTTRTTRTRSSAKAAAQAALELLETGDTQTQLPIADAPAPTTVEPITEPEVEQLDEGVLTTVAPAELEPAWAKLPPVTAPSQTNLVSYKIPFGNGAKHFVVSHDGGVTNEDAGVSQVAGVPVDFCLQISESGSDDYRWNARLRLAFLDSTGVMSELNLNAFSTAKSGDIYVTGPARSLIAALMSIVGTNDAHAFKAGARFSLKQGNAAKSKSGRASMFLNLSVFNQHLNIWSDINASQYYAIAPSTPQTLVLAMEQLKLDLANDGLFMDTPAVQGRELVMGEDGLASAAV